MGEGLGVAWRSWWLWEVALRVSARDVARVREMR